MPPSMKKGLGKGLNALLDDDSEPFSASAPAASAATFDSGAAKTAAQVSPPTITGDLLLELAKIEANPEQPRRNFDIDTLSELASSIREHGVIQPIVVERVGDDRYRIIAGERRTRAARMAGLEKVPVVMREYSDQRRLEVALIENVQREDLNPLEEAQAYRKLMELGNLSQEEVSTRVGKNRSTIANALRLLKLPESMHEALADGRLTSGHARAILSLVNPSDQELLYTRILEEELSVRAAERSAADLAKGQRSEKAAKKEAKTSASDPELEGIRQRFMERLGTKVTINGSMEKGSLHIDYYSMDDLDRLLELITGSANQ